MISSLPPPLSALPHPRSPPLLSSLPASLHPSLAANLSHTPATYQSRMDWLLQATALCSAHGQKRERDSHTCTFFSPLLQPSFISIAPLLLLHLSWHSPPPAPPPLCLHTSFPALAHPSVFPSQPRCPLLSSFRPFLFHLLHFPESCDIDSKVAVLLTAATLLNISDSVSVAACRGRVGEEEEEEGEEEEWMEGWRWRYLSTTLC